MTAPTPATVRRVVLSLGSNLGDRMETLQGAVDALVDAPGLDFVAVSSLYETAPVGGPDQSPYLNAVLLADSALSPEMLLERIRGVEDAFDRRRIERWGPRTLDIDIVAIGDHRCEGEELTLPHPRAPERAFVLVPWLEVDPQARLPGHGQVAELVKSVDAGGVHRRDDLVLQPPA